MIAERAAAELVQAASRIEQALREVHGGEYGSWLADSVGGLKLNDRRTIDALLSWQARIATTNYDNLFEDASHLRAVVWAQGDLALQVLRGVQPGILHLHGHYTSPETVVFGAKTYEDICRDVRARTSSGPCLLVTQSSSSGAEQGATIPTSAGYWSGPRRR